MPDVINSKSDAADADEKLVIADVDEKLVITDVDEEFVIPDVDEEFVITDVDVVDKPALDLIFPFSIPAQGCYPW